MAVNAKYVRVVADAGMTANFMSIAGNSHRYHWLSSELIKAMLDKGINVYEKLAEPAEDGSIEVELTEENYTSDNSGIVFNEASGAVVVQDLEKERADYLQEVHEEFMEKLGLEIKDQLEEKVEKYNKQHPVSGPTGSGETMTEEEEEDLDTTEDTTNNSLSGGNSNNDSITGSETNSTGNNP